MDSSQMPISSQDIVAFVLGEADALVSSRVSAAAGSDPAVGLEIERITSILTTLKEGVLEQAPAALRKVARELWVDTQHPTLAQWLGQMVESTLAVVFDSRQTPELAGFRGESDGHHMTYSDNTAEIDVMIEGEGNARVLRGQIMGARAESVAVISDNDDVLSSTQVAADGGFSVALGTGARHLCVKTDAKVYRLRSIQ